MTIEEYTPDVIVSGGGSVYLLEPHTTLAADWINEHTAHEEWQWFGNALAVDHYYLEDIITAMEDDNLDVELAGQRELEATAAIAAAGRI